MAQMVKYDDSVDVYYRILQSAPDQRGGSYQFSSVYSGSPMLKRYRGRGVNLLSFISRLVPGLAKAISGGIRAAKVVAPGLKDAATRVARRTATNLAKTAGEAALKEGERIAEGFITEYKKQTAASKRPAEPIEDVQPKKKRRRPRRSRVDVLS